MKPPPITKQLVLDDVNGLTSAPLRELLRSHVTEWREHLVELDRDTADELAFLALECERLGDRELGERILSLYAAMSGDLPDPGLVDFYKCFRACLRAKIAVQHLQDPGVGDRGKWRGRALEYLRLAAKYAGRLN